eukprot:1158137-Pelagomonas_calceolata.AAC.1
MHPYTAQGATAKKAAAGAGGPLQLGSNIPDFMELSAPAVMPPEMCPPWLPEDSWGRERKEKEGKGREDKERDKFHRIQPTLASSLKQ